MPPEPVGIIIPDRLPFANGAIDVTTTKPNSPALASDHRPPMLSMDDAVRLAAELYGITGSAEPLPSERDQNFLIRTASGTAYVLKLSQTGEDRSILECQNEVLDRLVRGTDAFRFPSVVATRGGKEIDEIEAPGGGRHYVRLLDYLPGVPLARVRPHSPGLLEGIGRLLGTLDRVLDGYTHPAAERALQWDPKRGREVVDRHLDAIADPARRTRVERFLEVFDTYAAPLLPELRTGVIHADGNDWNVLVSEPDDPLSPRTVVGLIDFGDMVHSWIAAEPAIAAAYAMMRKTDPLAAAARVVHGYHTVHPLTEPEIAAVFPLIGLRLTTSVVLAAYQRRLRPENEYLSVSEDGAWALLERLAEVHPRLAHYRLREACCLPPVPAAVGVVEWLERHAERIGPVLEPDPRTAKHTIFDLSVGSLELDGLRGRDDSSAWTDVLFGRLRAEGAEIGIGRYDEARRWYTGEAYRVETDDGPEWRTIHLGIDLFVPAGTPVLAPLDGVVHSVRDNAARLDYGPTVILRHEFDDVVFHTLYGHLAPDALALEPGRPVRKGEVIGHVGDRPGNGDWAPHLHLQLIADLLDREGEFPGVARPSERAIWRSLSPDPNVLLRIPGLEPAADAPSREAILARRREKIGPSLSIAYRKPLQIVRGRGAYLYDELGQAYLDCVNNVAHVGHSHPRVVDALVRQSWVLNTNTRYLHENLIRYAERLTATLPEPLSVCFFVCSGSEANELALRLARTHTGRRDVIVLDAAYHGNTGSLIELSPYKFDGPGGSGRPPSTHVVPLPDPYRGPYRGYGPETGRRYAEHVREATMAAAENGGVAAFFAESLSGCGGQVEFPQDFLAEAFRHVREAGGVCIADEVQVGFGRVGTDFWGFQTQDAVPDIVTMGKPIGNGHPLAAVVTTPEIAASFANGMEYFNTFGGNPVSCAVGLAVLDVIEEEGLQENARQVGERLRSGLESLMERHPLIGDVRGRGLFLGAELVLDRGTLEPAPRQAGYVIERMRDHGILLSTDGPFDNVLKIKPPIVFSEADADRLVETLDRVLGEDGAQGR